MSARKRKADDDFDQRSYDEGSTSPTATRQIARPSKKIRNNNVAGRPLALPRLLETLDAETLRNVLQQICEKHPQIGQEVVTSAPRPSPGATFEVLKRYQTTLQEAFPFGGGYTAYAYNRVRPQLEQLIEAISDYVPHYLPPNESSSTTSLNFLDGVTNIIHQLPDWDSQQHRYHKDDAYDEISRAWALVISEASKRGGGFHLHHGEWDLKTRKHNAQSGGRMQVAENALGNNLGWMGATGASANQDRESIRNQLFSGTYGSNFPVRSGLW